MEFLKWQKSLLEDLKNADLPKYEVEYIVSVVRYIDSEMEKNNKNISLDGSVNNMHRLVEKINTNSTGVLVIDTIEDKRMKSFFEQTGTVPFGSMKYLSRFFKNKPYIDNYISIFSQYGGLYKYVCTTFGYGQIMDDEYGEDEIPTRK